MFLKFLSTNALFLSVSAFSSLWQTTSRHAPILGMKSSLISQAGNRQLRCKLRFRRTLPGKCYSALDRAFLCTSSFSNWLHCVSIIGSEYRHCLICLTKVQGQLNDMEMNDTTILAWCIVACKMGCRAGQKTKRCRWSLGIFPPQLSSRSWYSSVQQLSVTSGKHGGFLQFLCL